MLPPQSLGRVSASTPASAATSDDDDEPAVVVVAGATPLGVRIAMKRHHQQQRQQQKQQLHDDASPTYWKNLQQQQQQSTSTTIPRGVNSSRAAAKYKLSSSSLGATTAAAPAKKLENEDKPKRHSSSLHVFLEGATVYLACLILPSLLGYVYQTVYNNNQEPIAVRAPNVTSLSQALSAQVWHYYEQAAEGICPNNDDDLESSSSSSVPAAAGDAESWGWNTAAASSLYSSAAAYYAVDWFCRQYNSARRQQQQAVEQETRRRRLLYSPDATYEDWHVVALFAVTLALIRVGIVCLLVPNLFRKKKAEANTEEVADELLAMVRSKSIHLLSRQYSLTPTMPARRTVSGDSDGFFCRLPSDDDDDDEATGQLPVTAPVLPSVVTPANTLPLGLRMENDDDREDGGLGMEASEDEDWANLIDLSESPPFDDDGGIIRERSLPPALPSLPATTPMSSPSKKGIIRPAASDKKTGDDSESSTLSPARRNLSASFAALADDDDDDDDAVPKRTASTSSSSSSHSPYTAPRYATAVFRLGYSFVASLLAWYSFRSANFWPWYVGGAGSTRNCWDLSGGLSLGMDADFDQRNAALRLYFLWQASYHWHAGAFHILTVVALLWWRNYGGRRQSSAAPAARDKKHSTSNLLLQAMWSSTTSTMIQTSFSTSYIRRLLQHALTLILIATAYVFSSLRRLAAIGMFAFDVSSCFLHLLQLCINYEPAALATSIMRSNESKDELSSSSSNDDSVGFLTPRAKRISRRDLTRFVYYGLVLPTFLISRFLIWPCLWYSAVFESDYWLRQLESTLVPGLSKWLKISFHMWMLLALGMTCVYWHRLVQHPHLHKILHE